MKRPTRQECLALLAEQADPAVKPFAWRIFSAPYTEEDALSLAELCLLTRQDLTTVPTLPALLNLARRVADLEEKADRRVRRRVLPESGVAQPSDGGWI